VPNSVRVVEENFGIFGLGKVWRQRRRMGHGVARCTVVRLAVLTRRKSLYRSRQTSKRGL